MIHLDFILVLSVREGANFYFSKWPASRPNAVRLQKTEKSFPGFEATTPPACFKLARLPGPAVQRPLAARFPRPICPARSSRRRRKEAGGVDIPLLRTIPLVPATDRPRTPFPHPCAQDNPQTPLPRLHLHPPRTKPPDPRRGSLPYLPPPPSQLPPPALVPPPGWSQEWEGTFYKGNLNKRCVLWFYLHRGGASKAGLHLAPNDPGGREPPRDLTCRGRGLPL